MKEFKSAYMNLWQVPGRVSGDEFADTGRRDTARALIRTLRVFEERNPERLGEIL
jgi:hypothetical protein